MLKTIGANSKGALVEVDTSAIEAALKNVVLTSIVSQKEQSTVYGAQSILSKEQFMVKVQQYESQKEKLAFLERAKQLQSLQSSAVMKITQHGALSDGRVFLVSEPLTGKSLRAYLKAKGKISATKATAIICQILTSLEAIHAAGLIHGNLRPENVYLRTVDDKPAATLIGFRGGKTRLAEYVSPEQTTEHEPSPRSDLYSIGAIFFELLTGRLPFLAKNLDELKEMQRVEAAPRPSAFATNIPPALEKLVMQCLEKHPEDRPASAASLKKQLSKTIPESEPITQLGVQASKKPLPKNIAWPVAFAVLGGLVACSIFAIVYTH